MVEHVSTGQHHARPLKDREAIRRDGNRALPEFYSRSIDRMLMKKLAKTVWVPSASSTTAGITSRMVSDGSRLPKPTAPQLATATTRAPAASPTSSVT